MKKTTVVFMLLLGMVLTSCSLFTKEKVCDTGKAAAGLVAANISAQLDCKNLDAVRADVEKRLVDLKICEQPVAPTPAPDAMALQAAVDVGQLVCGPVISGLVAGLVGQIPATWECSGGQLSEELKLKLVEACTKAF